VYSCPVCRYSQTLLSSHPSSSARSSHSIPFADPTSTSQSVCSCCSSTTNLWICLICGNIGCGRYGQAHAHAHYQSTTHLYALELETQRVWDYAGDGYVHRLIQNKADGKLVELPSAASSMGVTPREGGLGPSQADTLSAEKVEAIGIEYSYLLTSQLDSQRSFYEEQTTDLRSQISELTVRVQNFSNKFEQEQTRHKEEELQRQKEHEEKISQILKEKSRAEHRVDKVTELTRKLEKELREERAVSEGLMKNLAVMREKAECFDKERKDFGSRVRELEDQVRDVMFFLEAKTKIEQGDGIESEAAGGSVSVPDPPDPPKPNKKKKKSNKR
jgi:BRCA1-associated protein